MADLSKIAVITRTKDRPAFLKRALDSVANQTFNDYIHVIVNDGGDKAEVEELVKQLDKNQQAKTKLFHREKASGAPDTIFNESIDRVDSEYFALHDDDDTWHKDFLETTVQYLDTHTDDGAVVVKTDKIIEKVDNNHTITITKRQPWMEDLRAISLYRQCFDNQMTPIATLYRRSAYETVGKFDSTLPVVGDWEFGVRLLLQFDVSFIDSSHALAEYHHRTGGDNSFAKHNHRHYVTKVANHYLRQEITDGKLGIGYIMSSLKYEDDRFNTRVKRLLPRRIVEAVRKRRQ